jgi:hypothetical protein
MSTVDLNGVRDHVLVLRWIKAQRAQLKELEEQTRPVVEAAMGGAEVGLLDGEPAITWGTHKRTSFDQKAFGDDHPELLEEYKTTKPVRRFEVCDD